MHFIEPRRPPHYNYYRDYDPGVGRYLESDPLGIKFDLNSYRYVLGSPLLWFDQYGLYSACILQEQRCTDSKVVYGALYLVKFEVCTRRRCKWRCYHDAAIGPKSCFNIPCKDGKCQLDHGVEVVENHTGKQNLPFEAAPLCEDVNPADR